MATNRPDPTRSSALIVGAALVGLGTTSALALTRVFDQRSWLFAILGAVIGPIAIGVVVERARWNGFAALAAWAGSGVLYTVVAVAPGDTASGIPTPTAFGSWLAALGDAPEILTSATTPVSPVGGALLLALAATWAANASATWSALRLDGTLGAMVPTLALFVAVSALGEGPYALLTAGYAAAGAALLLARQHHGLNDRRTWFHASNQRPSRVLTGGVTSVIAIAVAGAVLGPNLPSARSAGLIPYQEWGEGGGGSGSVKIVSPLVDIGDQLNNPDEAEVFTVQSNVATYWRLVALDDYDGQVWGLENTTAKDGYAPALAGAPTRTIRQRFTMGPLGGPFLPAAYQAVGTRFLAEEYSIHESATLFLDQDGGYDGLVYEVESLMPEPTASTLAAIGPVDPDAFAKYLELPDDFPEAVTAEAEAATAGASTPFDQALALQAYFRDPDRFTYNTEIKGHDEDALFKFVLEERQGFCEQFAGAYAAMARAVGLPARVAVGFTPGTPQGDRFVVTTKNAHAWPEIWFEGLGWVRFEPTPGRYEPTQTDYNGDGDDPARPDPGTGPSTSTTVGGPTTTGPGASGPPPTLRPREDIEAGASGSTPGSGGSSAALTAAVWVVAVPIGLALAAVATMVVGAALRRRRRARADDARARIVGAWAQATERLAEAGIRRRPAATPVEFAMREAPAAGIGAAGPALLALSHLHSSALYAPTPPSEDDAQDAWKHVVQIERSVAATTRRGVRWRRRVRGGRPFA